MHDFFDYLAAQIDSLEGTILIYQARQAFAQAIKSGQLEKRGAAARTYELLRFCDFDELAPWLDKRPLALARVARFARAQGETAVAGILETALADHAEAAPDSAEGAQIAWGGTEATLSLLLQGLEQAVLRHLLAERGAYELPLPRALARRFPI